MKLMVLLIGTIGQVGRLIVESSTAILEMSWSATRARKPKQVAKLRAEGRHAVFLDLDDPGPSSTCSRA